jgi:hypothetical protein
MVDSTI